MRQRDYLRDEWVHELEAGYLRGAAEVGHVGEGKEVLNLLAGAAGLLLFALSLGAVLDVGNFILTDRVELD